jgi:RNA polymerase sigma factor (sigma-70 family)
MLSDAQKKYAEQAIALVEPCIAFFIQTYPCLRGVLSEAEMLSAAYYACAAAAKTYDPQRAGVSAYFSKSIMHELLKSCRREIRSDAQSVYRIPLDEVEQRWRKRPQDDRESRVKAMEQSLAALPSRDRNWITAFVECRSMREVSRKTGVPIRRVTREVNASLQVLRAVAESRRE